MSVHINAPAGSVAETVLLPGDPLRARWIAENFLESAVCFNEVRGAYGFTGLYKGKKVSVQASGMGCPSISIYANELIRDYNVQRLIRIGSAGSLQDYVHLRDLVIAMSASSQGYVNQQRFSGSQYAPTAHYGLLARAVEQAEKKKIPHHVGSLLTTDEFYQDDPQAWKHWASFGVLAVEMEIAALYTIAAKHQRQGLAICTISDSLVTEESLSSLERQESFADMVHVVLELA